MRAHGVPEQILTDNGKVFTGRFHHPPVEVLFDRICRENGVEHLLTAPRSPTTTGKVERFHRTLRLEFDTTRVFGSLALAQGALDEWVAYYNTDRPHQSLEDAVPEDRFHGPRSPRPRLVAPRPERPAVTGQEWVSRKVGANGIVCVGAQQVSAGKHFAGSHCDVLVTDELLQFWIGDKLVKTATRTDPRPIRKKRAAGTSPRR